MMPIDPTSAAPSRPPSARSSSESGDASGKSVGSPAAGLPQSGPSAPACYEDLPPEICQLIDRYSLQHNLDTPAASAVPALWGLNTYMQAVHDRPRQAAAALYALHTARGSDACDAALRALEQAPREYCDLYARAAVKAVARRCERLPTAPADTLLRRLLDSAAGRLAITPPPWLQVLRLLSRRPVGAPSPELVRTLLERLAAQQPAASTATWRLALGLVGRVAAHGDPDPAHFCLPGLDAARQCELRLMHACGRLPSRGQNAATLQALVARIEVEVSPPCRWPVLQMLARRWPPLAEPDHSLATGALRQALLRVPLADREAALRELPALAGIERRQTLLLAQVRELPADGAVRVLVCHRTDFAGDAAARTQFVDACRALALQARPAPALHRAVVRQIALAGAATDDREMSVALARLALSHCPRQMPIERVGVMALLPPDTLPFHHWRHEWERLLRQLSAEVEAYPVAQAGRLLDALLRGLQLPREQARVMPLVKAALGRLPPEARARALVRVVQASQAAPSPFGIDNFLPLLDACARLPCYLRDRLLDALDLLAGNTSTFARQQVERLRHDTAVATRALAACPAVATAGAPTGGPA